MELRCYVFFAIDEPNIGYLTRSYLSFASRVPCNEQNRNLLAKGVWGAWSTQSPAISPRLRSVAYVKKAATEFRRALTQVQYKLLIIVWVWWFGVSSAKGIFSIYSIPQGQRNASYATVFSESVGSPRIDACCRRRCPPCPARHSSTRPGGRYTHPILQQTESSMERVYYVHRQANSAPVRAC